MPAERQKQVLAALLAVLALVVGWQYVGGDDPAEAPMTAATRRAAQAAMPHTPEDVSLDALERVRLGPDDGGRNPFVFGARQVVVDGAGARRPVTGRPAVTQPVPVLLPPGPPPLPPIPFKFIGVVEGTARTKRLAVLSDSKGVVAHGSEGAIIDGRFRILSIGAESLDIAYADGRGRQTLRLTGQ